MHDKTFGERCFRNCPDMCCAGSSTQAVISFRQVTRIGTPQLTPHGAHPPVPLTHLSPDFRVRVLNSPPFPGSHSIQFATPHFVSRICGDESVELLVYAALRDITSPPPKSAYPQTGLCEFVFRAGKDTIAAGATTPPAGSLMPARPPPQDVAPFSEDALEKDILPPLLWCVDVAPRERGI
ncbi:hypothetical protein BDW22DRAFT_1433597 [Trametopsis cervina]|nr:hypothetical protein BDW22DRAFT_1433597 [Trametopsis cervina]